MRLRRCQANRRRNYLAHRMTATPTQQHDPLVLALLRAGHSPDEIYVLLWPQPDTRPVTLQAFRAMAQALDVAESTAEPAEQLTDEIKQRLISGQFFDQGRAPIPFEYPDSYDPELDHTWLEFDSLEEVDDRPDVPQDISDFIFSLK